jgi:Spy/CpxP family protein refolding chaperone
MGDNPKIRQAFEKSRAEYQAGLKKVLTKAQWKKYDAAVKKAMAERAQGRGGPGAPGAARP